MTGSRMGRVGGQLEGDGGLGYTEKPPANTEIGSVRTIFGEITLRFGTLHTEAPQVGLILLLMKFLTLSAAALFLIAAIISFVSNQATWVLSLAASVASLATWVAFKKPSR